MERKKELQRFIGIVNELNTIFMTLHFNIILKNG